jgi:hypothetical protein
MTGRQVPPPRSWSTPTVRQMMKLVVFAAVASLCLVPVVRWAEIGAVSWPFAVLMEAVAIPMVLAIVAFPMVRSGPLKDWLIRALLMTSVGVILAAAIYSLCWGAVGPQSLNLWAGSTGMTVGFLREVIVVLAFPFILLWQQLVPRLCPACKRWRLLPDGIIRIPTRTAPERAYRCLACDGRFWKKDGSWSAVDSVLAEHPTGDSARGTQPGPSPRIRRNPGRTS